MLSSDRTGGYPWHRHTRHFIKDRWSDLAERIITMTNIVITTLSPFENRGVEALGISIVQGLKRTFGDPSITVLARDLDVAKVSMEPYGVTVCRDKAWAPRRNASAFRKLTFRPGRYLRQKILGRLHPCELALAKADLVIVSGGDVYSSVYNTMERFLRQLDLPLSNGTPVLFLGQSIGLFDNQPEIDSFVATARRTRLTVREKISYDYVVDRLGVPAERVEMTADPAFLLDATRTAIHAEYGLVQGEYAVMAVSRGISEFKGLPHADHMEACLRVARFLIEKTGKVVLVPHVRISYADNENDLLLAQEIKAALGNDPACVVMGNRMHGAVEFKAALGSARFVVAERTHGAIGAMSMGVPTLSIGYSIKAEGVLRQLIKDDALLAKSLLPVAELTPDNAVQVIEDAWEVRDAFAAALARTLPAVKARAARNFEIARELVAR
jgi:polysaccharide pyruvyl transferase WcaK-like protein